MGTWLVVYFAINLRSGIVYSHSCYVCWFYVVVQCSTQWLCMLIYRILLWIQWHLTLFLYFNTGLSLMLLYFLFNISSSFVWSHSSYAPQYFFSKTIKIWCAIAHWCSKKNLSSLKIFVGGISTRITVCRGTRICAPAIAEPVCGPCE